MTNSDRILALRAHLTGLGVDGVLVPRADEHLGEYVPAGAERLAWLTGFTGSAGLAVVLMDRAAIFTDGRYTLQLSQQADPGLFEFRHIVDDPAIPWVRTHAPAARIGYDPWLLSEEALAKWTEAGVEMQALPHNPIDAVWLDRPAAPAAPAVPHPLQWSGTASEAKRATLGATLREAGQDAAVVTDPASIAWLLNIRGGDVAFTPFALGFLVLRADETAVLVMDPAKLGADTRAWLGNGVTCVPRSALDGDAGQPRGITRAGWIRRARPFGSRRGCGRRVRRWWPGRIPAHCSRRARTRSSRTGARAAQARDAVAICRFLHWLDTDGRGRTEMQAAAQLLALRAAAPEFRGESFPAIAGVGAAWRDHPLPRDPGRATG